MLPLFVQTAKGLVLPLWAVFMLVTLVACEYSGSPLTEMTALAGPPEHQLAPSFPLDLPPEERLRTAEERRDLLDELQTVSDQEAQRGSAAARAPSTHRLGEAGRTHFTSALAQIEAASSQDEASPECEAINQRLDQDLETTC